MKLFKQLDDYLLRNYPSIWITRIHIFLPIGIGIITLLTVINLAIGWNVKDDLPANDVAVVLMIIPVLIYLVYWFIFQSRYNVAKSGGRMPLHFEYLNFILYFTVFLTAFLIICAIPISNNYKIGNAISKEQYLRDKQILNIGNGLVMQPSIAGIEFNGNTLRFYPVNMIYDYEYDYVEAPKQMTVSFKTAEQIIMDFIEVHNRYTHQVIRKSPKKVLAELQEDFYGGGAFDDSYSDSYWEIQNKLVEISRNLTHNRLGIFQSLWFWKISFGLIAFLALTVWIFKQMDLRTFIYGLIALCLTPLIGAIIGVILFELLNIQHEEEKVVSLFILIVYGVVTAIVISHYYKTVRKNTGYVLAYYLQFFLPMLPLFLLLFFDSMNISSPNNRVMDDLFNFLYYSGWIIGLLCIAPFSKIYAKFRSLPSAT